MVARPARLAPQGAGVFQRLIPGLFGVLDERPHFGRTIFPGHGCAAAGHIHAARMHLLHRRADVKPPAGCFLYGSANESSRFTNNKNAGGACLTCVA